MSDDLYDRDFFLWTQAQSQALRARRGGDNALDYDHLAEEIEDLGRAERNKAASYVRQILTHLYKVEASASDQPKAHWRIEIGNFQDELRDVLTNAIRREIEAELEALHRLAARRAAEAMAVYEPDVMIDAERRWSLAEIEGPGV